MEDLEQRRVILERRRESVEAQAAALWREFEDEADVVGRLLSHGSTGVEDRAGQRAEQGRLRRADPDKPEPEVADKPEPEVADNAEVADKSEVLDASRALDASRVLGTSGVLDTSQCPDVPESIAGPADVGAGGA